MTDRIPELQQDERPPDIKSLPVLPPLSALAEIVILFALIYIVDELTPTISVLDLSPHPFWIPVLLLSLQYGTVSGFLAAATAIGLSLYGGFPEQEIGENLFAYFLRVFGQPILWIGVALFVGQFRMRQLGAEQELRIANHTLTAQRDDLARHSQQLSSRVELLERELTTRHAVPPHATAAVLAKTIAAGGLHDERTGQAVLERAASAMFPDAIITAYRVRDGYMAEVAVSGRKIGAGPRIRIPGDDPLYRAVVEERRSVSVLEKDGESVLKSTGHAAVPIKAPLESEVIDMTAARASEHPAINVFGMLVIEKARPAVITQEGIVALEQLARALEPCAPLGRIPRETATGPMHQYTRARAVLATQISKATDTMPHVKRSNREGLVARLSQAATSPDATDDINEATSNTVRDETLSRRSSSGDEIPTAAVAGKSPDKP